MDLLATIRDWLGYLFPLLLILFFGFIIIKARKNTKKYHEDLEKSFSNQKEIIGLLKEIRDSLKK